MIHCNMISAGWIKVATIELSDGVVLSFHFRYLVFRVYSLRKYCWYRLCKLWGRQEAQSGIYEHGNYL